MASSNPEAGAVRDWIAGVLLLAAAPLFVAGLVMPAVSVTTFAVFQRDISLLDGVVAFFEKGDFFIFAVVLVFTVMLPAAKILTGLLVWTIGPDQAWDRLVRLFDRISRWSMLDVFIVAITVMLLEGSLIARTDIGLGVILFAGAVVLSTAATHRLARRHGE